MIDREITIITDYRMAKRIVNCWQQQQLPVDQVSLMRHDGLEAVDPVELRREPREERRRLVLAAAVAVGARRAALLLPVPLPRRLRGVSLAAPAPPPRQPGGGERPGAGGDVGRRRAQDREGQHLVHVSRSAKGTDGLELSRCPIRCVGCLWFFALLAQMTVGWLVAGGRLRGMGGYKLAGAGREEMHGGSDWVAWPDGSRRFARRAEAGGPRTRAYATIR